MTSGTNHPNNHEVVIDARGTLCPQPVVDLARAVLDNNVSQSPTTFVLLSDDPAALYDVPAWCRMRNCTVDVTTADDGSLRFDVRRSTAD